jgi:integrase
MVLTQAVIDNRITVNPADHVKLPSERTQTHTPGVIDDPSQFLSAAQVSALVNATPWPFNVYVHLAAWSGLRAGEMAGLQVGDVQTSEVRSSAPALLHVERTVIPTQSGLVYDSPKTKGSRRRVPLPPETSALLAEYLSQHPRRNEPTAPLFPSPIPNGNTSTALALDWSSLFNHMNFYRLVFQPAVLKANAQTETPILPPTLNFHALRHTYASLCVHAGIPPLAISRFMGHSKVTTTLSIYTHLFQDDHSDAMAALAALSRPLAAENVVPLRKRGT